MSDRKRHPSRRPLMLALFVAAASLLFSKYYLQRYELQVSGGERVPLVVVLRDVERGQLLTRDDLGVREVPLSYVEERDVRSVDMDRVVGIEAVTSLRAQQGLQWSDLAVEPDDRHVSRLIVPGKRAVSIHPGRISAVAGRLVRPGDYVDVLATLERGTGVASALSSIVLLQRVLVLAVGAKTEREATHEGAVRAGVEPEPVLTLSLDLQEAQLLSLAQQGGHLSIAVRHPDDQRIQRDFPELAATSLVEARKTVLERKHLGAGPVAIPQRIMEAE